ASCSSAASPRGSWRAAPGSPRAPTSTRRSSRAWRSAPSRGPRGSRRRPPGCSQGPASAARSPAGTTRRGSAPSSARSYAGPRSVVDGPRLGIHAETVAAVLSERPVRLTPLPLAPGAPRSLRVLSGQEPRTGVVFEAVTADGGAVVLTSGFLPEVR